MKEGKGMEGIVNNQSQLTVIDAIDKSYRNRAWGETLALEEPQGTLYFINDVSVKKKTTAVVVCNSENIAVASMVLDGNHSKGIKIYNKDETIKVLEKFMKFRKICNKIEGITFIGLTIACTIVGAILGIEKEIDWVYTILSTICGAVTGMASSVTIYKVLGKILPRKFHIWSKLGQLTLWAQSRMDKHMNLQEKEQKILIAKKFAPAISGLGQLQESPEKKLIESA